jgi:hypothetical protein
MTAAEDYLKSLIDQKNYIVEMMRHREELIERANSIKSIDISSDKVQSGYHSDHVGDQVSEIAALEQEMAEENMKLLESAREFKMLLKNVRNASCWQVLNYIYGRFYTEGQTAKMLNRTKTWVQTKHKEGVKAFAQANEDFLKEWEKTA